MASPPTPNRRKRSGWLSILMLAVGLLFVVWIFWKPAATSPSPPPDVPAGSVHTATITSHPAPTVRPAVVASEASPNPTPGPGTPGRMLALSVKFENGRLVETGREEHAGVVRPRRGIDGQPGLYHRILDAQGKVLFENLVSDPRVIPYDTTDDGKTLRGGTAIVQDIPLQLRLPSGVSGRLEVYRTETGSWTRASLAPDQHLVGTFDLR